MSGKITVKTDVNKFNNALQRLKKKMSARQFAEFIDHEAGRVLYASAKKTGTSSVKKINAEYQKFLTKKPRDPRDPRALNAWNEKVKAAKVRLKEKEQRIGLAKQTWLQIGNDLGLNTKGKGLARAQKATVKGAMIRHKTSSLRVVNSRKYGLRFTYENPVGRFKEVGARGALSSAIYGRRRFLETNLGKKVFEDTAAIAKKYPGLTIYKR